MQLGWRARPAPPHLAAPPRAHPRAGADDGDYEGELLPYITGDKQAPVPTYFIGGWGQGSRQALEALSGSSGANVHYLGRSGVAADGGPGCRYHGEADVKLLQAALAAEGDVDLLLTCDWPSRVLDALPLGTLPQGMRTSTGVPTAAEAALAARPRYHVAGSRRTFYARAPYLNADLGAGAHVTRFVGLAEVGNPAKQKWLHALGLAPAVEMTPEQLQAVPEGSTASPYAAGGGGEEGEGPGGRKRGVKEEEDLGSQDWRWQQQQKRQKGPGGPVAAPSLGACVLGCWQCMAAGGLWGGMGGCAGFTRACPPPFGAAV